MLFKGLRPLNELDSTLAVLRTTGIYLAWLMCSWSFSPYTSEWWQCQVSHRYESTYDATLVWTQNGHPAILSHYELAKMLVHLETFDRLKWSMVTYTVSCHSRLLFFLELLLNKT